MVQQIIPPPGNVENIIPPQGNFNQTATSNSMPTDKEMTEKVLDIGFYLDSLMRIFFVYKANVEAVPVEGGVLSVRIYHYILVSSGEIGTITNMQVKEVGLSPISDEGAKDVIGPVFRMITENLMNVRAQTKVLEEVHSVMSTQKDSYGEEKTEE